MPIPEVIDACRPVTRSELVATLQALGVSPGRIVMVHARLSALGWVVGGTQTVVQALLDVLGNSGTVCAQTSWEDIPIGMDDWPDRWRRAYEAELPPFDAVRSGAAHWEGRLAERIRTWPEAHRSANPCASLAAVGGQAGWLTDGHSLDYGFGFETPYARIADTDGAILLLGAPLESISLLHHAEAIADVRNKARTTYRVPISEAGHVRWRVIHELDLWGGVLPYERLSGDEPALRRIARDALAAGVGSTHPIGDAQAHFFPARGLTAFAKAWLEAHFSSGGSHADHRRYEGLGDPGLSGTARMKSVVEEQIG